MSMQSDLMDAESMHELDCYCQDAEMQTEVEPHNACLLPLMRFMDVDSLASAE